MLAEICHPARKSHRLVVALTLMAACAFAAAATHPLTQKVKTSTKLHVDYKSKESLLLKANVSPSKATGTVTFYKKGPCKATGLCKLPFVKLGSSSLKAGVAEWTTEYDGLPKWPVADGTFPYTIYFKATYAGFSTFDGSTSSVESVGACGSPRDPGSLVQRRC